MNKMMKTVVASVLLALGLSVRADYLLWQVEQTAEDAIPFTYAKLSVKGGSLTDQTYLSVGVWTQDGPDLSSVPVQEIGHSNFEAEQTGPSVLQSYANLGEYANSAYSFAVELYSFTDGHENLLAVSDYVRYSEMVRDFHVYSNMSQSGITPYTYGTFRAVPEPTGGLLVLMGLGALALRRKRAVAPEG